MTDTRIYYTIPEVAKQLRISQGKAYEMVNTGILGHMRIGAKILVSDDDKRDFERKNHFKPPAERKF